jgi:hypothetical protein
MAILCYEALLELSSYKERTLVLVMLMSLKLASSGVVTAAFGMDSV